MSVSDVPASLRCDHPCDQELPFESQAAAQKARDEKKKSLQKQLGAILLQDAWV